MADTKAPFGHEMKPQVVNPPAGPLTLSEPRPSLEQRIKDAGGNPDYSGTAGKGNG